MNRTSRVLSTHYGGVASLQVMGFIYQVIVKHLKFDDDIDGVPRPVAIHCGCCTARVRGDSGGGVGGADAKEALMLWLRNNTAGVCVVRRVYSRCHRCHRPGYNDVNIDDFPKGLHNGMAFCALIHKHRCAHHSLRSFAQLRSLTASTSVPSSLIGTHSCPAKTARLRRPLTWPRNTWASSATSNTPTWNTSTRPAWCV